MSQPASAPHEVSVQSPSDRDSLVVIFAFAAGCLLIHLIAWRGYGWFRDELYLLACARHLDWGYPDHPAGYVLVMAVIDRLFGPSLWMVRFAAALGNVATVALAGFITREMGG